MSDSNDFKYHSHAVRMEKIKFTISKLDMDMFNATEQYVQFNIEWAKRIENYYNESFERQRRILLKFVDIMMTESIRFNGNKNVMVILNSYCKESLVCWNQMIDHKQQMKSDFNRFRRQIQTNPNAPIDFPEINQLPKIPNLFGFYDEIFNLIAQQMEFNQLDVLKGKRMKLITELINLMEENYNLKQANQLPLYCGIHMMRITNAIWLNNLNEE